MGRPNVGLLSAELCQGSPAVRAEAGCLRWRLMRVETAVERSALGQIWQSHWQSPTFRVELPVSLGTLLGVGWLYSRVGAWIEARSGTVLDDPILRHLPALDLTWFTFSVMYVAVISALVSLLHHPYRLLFGLRVYAGVMLMRLVAMYLTELDDPLTAIPLQDPVTRLIFQVRTIPTKDLFFSGHTATMFTLYLMATNALQRHAFLAGTVVIGVCVLLQHVHYAFDVFAAPFFAFGVYHLVGRIRGESQLSDRSRPGSP
ncbi:phosphatase PAP2-related protein [Myxococcota bacterium]